MQRLPVEDIRALIAGPARLLLVEAPAGHGKTHEAANAAGAMSRGLQRGQQVLLLSHTNAARDEVRRRFGSSASTRVQTLDSLACDIVSAYARHLGVPTPVRPGATHLDQPTFPRIRRLACQLLRDAPVVARGLAWRYPVVLVDEHQDSTIDQHELVWLIYGAGDVRLRLFGDRLQAIFGFSGDLVDWPRLLVEHEHVELLHGYRWDGQPALRDWLASARSALLAGDAIDLRHRPTCVQVHHWEGRAPGPKQTGHCPECLKVLGRLNPAGQVAYLVRSREHGYGLAVRMRSKIKLHEAGDVQDSLAVLESAEAADGDPAALCLLLADTLREWGIGIPKDLRDQLARACHADGVGLAGRKRLVPLARACDAIYAEPTVRGFLRSFVAALAIRDDLGWSSIRRDSTYLLASIPPETEDPILALGAQAHAHRSRVGPRSKVMTVHKAKGREYDTVVLPYAAASSFSASEEGIRLMYVALTRSQRQLHILIPSQGRSELFDF
jgi:UvrD-like helicase C-terminal domain/UvrD/REP helicase N-terminal domain